MEEQELKKAQELEKKWQQECRKLYGKHDYSASSASGIPLKPVYTPLDLAGMDFSNIGLPGIYPYTRWSHPLQYQAFPWMNEQGLGYGLPEHTRERFDHLCQQGMSGYLGPQPPFFIVFDLISQAGYDPDHPAVQGRVGECGVSFSTLKDFELLLDGLPIDKIWVMIFLPETSLVGLAQYIVYAEKRGIPPEKLRGMTLNCLYRQWYWCVAGFPIKSAFKLMVELIKYCTRHMPMWNTTALDGYSMEEAGANAVQETAFTLATMAAITQECIRAGLDPDTFLPRFSAHLSVTNDFIESVAKLRCFRRMWARLNKERFSCQNPKSLRARFMTQTAGSSLVAQQPLNNIIRAAFQTLAAVLGGSDSIWTVAYDEPFWTPSEQAHTLALRTQQIVQYESNIPAVVDPLAGSYYLEWLTNQLEESATGLMKQIEEMGYARCWENGWFRQQLEQEAYRWRQSVDQGEKIVIGLNKFASNEKPDIPTFSIDPRVEETAVRRVQEFRARRNNTKTLLALKKLKQVAGEVNTRWPDGGDLMPALIEAARADATLGEMMGILKEVFGWGYLL